MLRIIIAITAIISLFVLSAQTERPIVYTYDGSGVYKGQKRAHMSQREPGKIIQGANETLVQPPTPGIDETAKFDPRNKQWSLIEDHRDKLMYSTANGRAKHVEEAGAIPEGYTLKSVPVGCKFCEWDSTKNDWVENNVARTNAQNETDRLQSFWDDPEKKNLESMLNDSTAQAVRDYYVSNFPSLTQAEAHFLASMLMMFQKDNR